LASVNLEALVQIAMGRWKEDLTGEFADDLRRREDGALLGRQGG